MAFTKKVKNQVSDLLVDCVEFAEDYKEVCVDQLMFTAAQYHFMKKFAEDGNKHHRTPDYYTHLDFKQLYEIFGECNGIYVESIELIGKDGTIQSIHLKTFCLDPDMEEIDFINDDLEDFGRYR